jgi:Fungal protein kinase
MFCLLQKDDVTGTPLFLALGVLCKTGHTLATELESLFYILLYLLSGGHLHWQGLDLSHHMVLTARAGAMLYPPAFQAVVLRRVHEKAHPLLLELRKKIFEDEITIQVFRDTLTQQQHLLSV